MSAPDFDRLTALLRDLEKTCEKARELREQIAACQRVGAFHPQLDRVNKLIAERLSTNFSQPRPWWTTSLQAPRRRSGKPLDAVRGKPGHPA